MAECRASGGDRRVKAFLVHPIFLWGLRLVLAGVFIYAGILKIGDPLAFADNIDQYQLLPDACINVIALSLPVFEVLSGVMLLTGRFDRLASGSIVVMAVIFAIALTSAIVRGLVIDCGCFGSSEPDRWSAWWALGRDLLILAGAGWIYARKLRI
ncbi:MAG: MauE/DoxX family redox-associated membrane protein [Verrucomicrobiota bacterium]